MKKNMKLLITGFFAIAAMVFVFSILVLIKINYAKENAKLNQSAENINNNSKIAWGAYTGNTASSFANFEKKVGKKADIHAIFVGWNDPFPASLASQLKSNNQTLLIYWEQNGITLDQIINDESDYYIKRFATEVKKYKGPVILVPFHEMNGNWNSWNGTVGNNTPEKLILAWRHIYYLFKKVSNVKFGWAVNNISYPDTKQNQIHNYYPGDAYVDYVGVNGFNFGNPWLSYKQIFSNALKQLQIYEKPVYIFSMASADGTNKASWITDAFSQIYSNPTIRGWIWFNQNKERNWLIDSDQNSLKAFREAIQ